MHGVNKYSYMCLIGLARNYCWTSKCDYDYAVNHNLTSQLNIKGNKDIR